MNRLIIVTLLLVQTYLLQAQNKCNGCLKVEVMKTEYYDNYWKIPNGYIVDERGDTFDFNLLDINLTFSSTNDKYMVYAGAFDPSYYLGDTNIGRMGHFSNLDSFTQTITFPILMIENQHGEFKMLHSGSEFKHPTSFQGTELSVGFYQSFKIANNCDLSMQMRVLNNSLKIRESDSLIRIHYLYSPSPDYLRKYITQKIHHDLFEKYADSAICNDCSNAHLISNWFELSQEFEIPIIKKDAIDSLIVNPRYKWNWPYKDIVQGNGLYALLFTKVEYLEDKNLWFPNEIFRQKDFTVGLTDSLNRPIQIIIPKRGLIMFVNNKVLNDTSIGLIYSILLDINGDYTGKRYSGQLPLALNYSDNLIDLRNRYEFSNVIEEGKYIHFYLNHGINGTKITYNKELLRISEIELYYGSWNDIMYLKNDN